MCSSKVTGLLQPEQNSVFLSIRVLPGTTSRVERRSDGLIRIGVREPPERGRATSAALRALAIALGVPIDTVYLVHGGASRNKRVRVTVAPDVLRERIDRLPMALD